MSHNVRGHYFSVMEKMRALRDQQKTVLENRDAIPVRESFLRAEIDASETSLKRIKAEFARGIGSELEFETERGRLATYQTELDCIPTNRAAIETASRDVDAEIMAHTHVVARALECLAEDLIKPFEISIQNDKKLRAQIVKVFAFICAAGDKGLGGGGAQSSWDLVLSHLFHAPAEQEFKDAYSEALTDFEKIRDGKF